MSRKELFANYRLKLADHYPNAPTWVRQLLAERLDDLLALDDSDFDVEAKTFRVGAVRAIADQCGSECDELLSDIPRL